MKKVLLFSVLIGLFLFHSCSKENVENGTIDVTEVTPQILAKDALFKEVIVEWFQLHKYGIEKYHLMTEAEKQQVKSKFNGNEEVGAELILNFYEANSEIELEEDLKPIVETYKILVKKYPSLNKISENERSKLFSDAGMLLKFDEINEDGVESRGDSPYSGFLWWNFDCSFPLKHTLEGYNCSNGNNEQCLLDWNFCISTARHNATSQITDCGVDGISIIGTLTGLGATGGSVVGPGGTIAGDAGGFSVGVHAGAIFAIICIDDEFTFFRDTACPACQNALVSCCN